MATGSVVIPNWADRQAELQALSHPRPDFNGGGGAAGGSSGLLGFIAGGAQPQAQAAPGFGDQQSAMDKFFQLKQMEALQQVAKRADNLSAARGLHIDGGVSTQMEQELGNDAIGQLNQQQAGANADLMQQQRNYALQQQQMAMQAKQFAEQQHAQEQQAAWERSYKEKLYNDMKAAGTGAGGGQADRMGETNPFATTFGTGQSSTGTVIGGPAQSNSNFGSSNLASHNAPVFPGASPAGYNTPSSSATGAPPLGQPSQPSRAPSSNPFSNVGAGLSAAQQATNTYANATQAGQLAGTTASFMNRR